MLLDDLAPFPPVGYKDGSDHDREYVGESSEGESWHGDISR